MEHFGSRAAARNWGRVTGAGLFWEAQQDKSLGRALGFEFLQTSGHFGLWVCGLGHSKLENAFQCGICVPGLSLA